MLYYYNRALQTLDTSFCEAISVGDQISACMSAVRSKEEYLRENYPDELEAIYKINRLIFITYGLTPTTRSSWPVSLGVKNNNQ